MKFEEWLSQQNGVIEVDCGCVTTEAFYHWMRVAYEAGNSPVVPDDVSIFEAAIEECKKCDSIDEHAWNHGVLAVIAEYESCRAAMLQDVTLTNEGDIALHNYRTALEGIGHIRRTLKETFGGLHGTHVEPDVLMECKTICDAIYAAYSGNSPVIPDGYVMVPKEATLEMIKSGASAASNGMLIPGIYKAMLAAADCSIPMISDRWIPVSKRMPEIGDIVLTSMGGVVNVGETECSAANCRFFTSVISGRELPATYWMPLPAGPME